MIAAILKKTAILLARLIVFHVILCAPVAALAGTVTLGWDAPSAYSDGSPLTVALYKVYYRPDPGVYSASTSTTTTTTTKTIPALSAGGYCFVVTALDADNLESDYSSEICTTIPPAQQFNLSVAKSGAGSGTVSSSPAGISCGSTCGAAFDSGTVVTLTAAPAASSLFTGWSGACSGTGGCAVTMDAAKSVIATFALKTFVVTPSAGPNGTINPSSPQTVNYNAQTSFTVTPNSGYAISGVSGCGGALSGATYTTGAITGNCTVSASFAALPSYTLTVSKTGEGAVNGSPGGISCGGACSQTYVTGTAVALAAAPGSGWDFNGWSGACSGTGSCTVVMNGPKSVVATFRDATAPVLSVSTLPDGAYTNDPDLNVSGIATDNAGVQSLTINGIAVTVNGDHTFSGLVTLAGGSNTVTTTAADQAGNSVSDVRVVFLDPTAPELSITAPADNVVVAAPVLTITGSVNETATVSVVLNDEAPLTATMDGTVFSAVVILRPGVNTVTLAATDPAGNASNTRKVTVTYDDQGPSVSITSPPRDLTTSQPVMGVQGSVTDALGVASASISVDGEVSALGLDANGSFHLEVFFPVEGTHVIVVNAVDQAGRNSTARRNVIYAKIGDLNDSGAVDIRDALSALRHVIGAEPIADETVMRRCDVAPLGTDGRPDPDGAVNIADALLILRKAVGLVSW